MDSLAIAIARRREPALMRSILRNVMEYANLRRHFVLAAKLLTAIPDLIPDDHLTTVATWLLPRCRELPVRNGGGVMRSAWEALRELGSRMPEDMSKQIIETALSHPVWNATPPRGNRILPER